MVEHYGSQCGYCTPGFVVSLFEAYYRDGCREPWQISDQLCGNLLPLHRLPADPRCGHCGVGAARNCRFADKFKQRLAAPLAPAEALAYAAGAERFFRPTSLADLFALKQKHPTARLVAGATEIGVEVNKKFKAFPLLISTEAVPELIKITKTAAAWRIGAAATLTAIEGNAGREFPSVAKMLRVFALPADPQPGDARRQSRDSLAHR